MQHDTKAYLVEVHLRGAADDGGGEEGSCKGHQEDQDHQERLGKEAVGKVGVEDEQKEGECGGGNRSHHRGDREPPSSNVYNSYCMIQNKAQPISGIRPQGSSSQARDDEH